MLARRLTFATLCCSFACDAEELGPPVDTEEVFADYSAPPTWCASEDGEREEFFVLDAINAQLDEDEDLRQFAGLDHVQTCEDARDFVQAKGEYYEQNPSYAEDADATESDYPLEDMFRIANGSPSDFQPSVLLTISQGQGWTDSRTCTGFIIGPSEIVTAAHCIPADKHRPVKVTARQGFAFATTNVCVANCSSNSPNAWGYRHPNYTGSGDTSDDVGVFVFDEPFGVFANQSQDRVRMMVNKTWKNAPIGVYGWGRDTQSGGAGVAREGNMTVSWAGTKHFTANANQSRVCKGDSGGPAIRTSVTDQPLVVGVASQMAGSIGPGCPYSDGFNRWAQVGPKIPWIESRIGRRCNRYTAQSNSAIRYARCW